MDNNSFNYRTPASLLVEVAKIAAPFKGKPDKLNLVATQVSQLVPVLSYDVANVIAREMGLSLTQVYNFITFYAMLSTKPHGKYMIRTCRNVSCHVNGGVEVVQAIEDQLGIKVGETTEDGKFTLDYCSCLGLCEIAPAIMINKKVYGNLTAESVRGIIKAYVREEVE